MFLWGCSNSSTDSVKEAKKENTAKLDSQAKTRAGSDSLSAVLPSKADADFLVNAASGGMLEIQLAHLAQKNAHNQRLKHFAAMMIKDHGEISKKLKAVAISKNITIPDSVSNQQQKEERRLEKMKGAAFDEAYIDKMVADHKKNIEDFQRQAKDGNNEAIKAFARDNLRMLYIHLDSAYNIQRAIPKMPQPTATPIK